MKEVKFACPHCSQHIACDGGYAELSIECPSCGGKLVVPRLTAADSARGGMVVVASASLPPPRQTTNLPPFDPWIGRHWAGNSGIANEETPVLSVLWGTMLFGTFVLTFVLLEHRFDLRATVACLIVGLILTGFVRAKSLQRSNSRALLHGLGFAVLLLVVAPVVLVGVLFIGCTACSQ